MPEGDNPGAGWGLALGTASWAVFIAIFLSGFVRYGGNGYDKPAFLVPVWAWQAIPVVGLLVAIAATAYRRTRALGGAASADPAALLVASSARAIPRLLRALPVTYQPRSSSRPRKGDDRQELLAWVKTALPPMRG
jgi:hypothetical protein